MSTSSWSENIGTLQALVNAAEAVGAAAAALRGRSPQREYRARATWPAPGFIDSETQAGIASSKTY